MKDQLPDMIWLNHLDETFTRSQQGFREQVRYYVRVMLEKTMCTMSPDDIKAIRKRSIEPVAFDAEEIKIFSRAYGTTMNAVRDATQILRIICADMGFKHPQRFEVHHGYQKDPTKGTVAVWRITYAKNLS